MIYFFLVLVRTRAAALWMSCSRLMDFLESPVKKLLQDLSFKDKSPSTAPTQGLPFRAGCYTSHACLMFIRKSCVLEIHLSTQWNDLILCLCAQELCFRRFDGRAVMTLRAPLCDQKLLSLKTTVGKQSSPLSWGKMKVALTYNIMAPLMMAGTTTVLLCTEKRVHVCVWVCVSVCVKGLALSYIRKTKAISKEDNWTWIRATGWSGTLKLWTHLLGCRAPCQGHSVENLPPPNTHASSLRWLHELFLIWVNLTWD